MCVCALPFTCRIFTNLNRWQTIDQRKWQLCEQFAFSCIMSKCIVDWLNTPNSRGPGTHDHLSWPTKTRWHGGENVPATSWTVFKLSQCVVYQHPLRRVLCSYRNGMWPTQEPPCRSMLWKTNFTCLSRMMDSGIWPGMYNNIIIEVHISQKSAVCTGHVSYLRPWLHHPNREEQSWHSVPNQSSTEAEVSE